VVLSHDHVTSSHNFVPRAKNFPIHYNGTNYLLLLCIKTNFAGLTDKPCKQQRHTKPQYAATKRLSPNNTSSSSKKQTPVNSKGIHNHSMPPTTTRVSPYITSLPTTTRLIYQTHKNLSMLRTTRLSPSIKATSTRRGLLHPQPAPQQEAAKESMGRFPLELYPLALASSLSLERCPLH
jgi:hypothetical protein